MPKQQVSAEGTLTPVPGTHDPGDAGTTVSGADETKESPPKGGTELFDLSPPKASEPPPDQKPKPFRYTSWEEAEKAHGEAERKMHEATAEAAKLREERDAYQQTVKILSERTKQAGTPTEKDRLTEIKHNLTQTIKALDFTNDLQAAEKLSEAVVSANREITDYTLSERSSKEQRSTAAHDAIKTRIKETAPGLERFYDSLFLPTLDRLWRDEVFRLLPDQVQFGRVLSEVTTLVDEITKNHQAGQTQRDDAARTGAAMGKGGPTIPMTPSGEKDNLSLGSLSEDMKALKEHQRKLAQAAK